MNDLISRQAAISAICNACGKIDCDKMDKCEKLQLPPANCSEFPNNSDTISRQAVINELERAKVRVSYSVERAIGRGIIEILDDVEKDVRGLQSAEPKIIYCKDCRKHNKKVGFDENFHTVWKEDACPLASWRGKAQGHEFDYQYCVFGERRTE